MDNSVTIWSGKSLVEIPKNITNIKELVNYSVQLSARDRNQISSAFEAEHYNMVSTYVWTKTITALKNQLSKMGITFIAEMLDRPDLTESSSLQQGISEYEAIRLSEELGIISGTGAFRLKQAMSLIAHFNNPELEDDFENEITREDAITTLRTCIQSILGYEKIDAALDFKDFRKALEEETFQDENAYVIKLLQSPYFFYRATIRILLSLIKSTTSAQLENTLLNSNLIIPKLWPSLKQPEKWQIGRCYAELFTDGKTKAASGLKQVLLKVKGFDFVPEDLRSTSFIKAANEILTAHENINNFYNEPGPVLTLSKMGSVIPIPAFSTCMTAVLSVKLGNSYGVSHGAQPYATDILRNVPLDRWKYFFSECLPTDERILYKLIFSNPRDRWVQLFSNFDFDLFIEETKDRNIKILLKATKEKDTAKIKRLAENLYEKLGYSNS